MASTADHFEFLVEKVKTLSRVAWNGECEWPVVEQWLAQFIGHSGVEADDERQEMLYLLSNFLYFGTREIRELLRAAYRDCFRRRIVQKLRRANGGTTDYRHLERLYQSELSATRFLPVGNPSESSAHLLYYFRQQNGLPVRLFINAHEVLERGGSGIVLHPDVTRYIFLDDFAGSGDQALDYAGKVAAPARELDARVEFYYFVLFATSTALQAIRASNAFQVVDCVVEIGEEHQAFSAASVYYMVETPGVCRERAKRVARYYGSTLNGRYPLGYRDGQLVLGFAHNVPDNSLPIFWFSNRAGVRWTAPFVRYPKF